MIDICELPKANFSIYFIYICSCANDRIFFFLLKKHPFKWKSVYLMNSINMLKDNYLFGNGVNYFNKYYMSNQASYFRTESNSHYLMLADNGFHPLMNILFLIEYGIVGFLF